MRLAQRLLLGVLTVVVVLVGVAAVIAGGRLRERLHDDTRADLAREAELVGLQWVAGADPDSTADAAGAATERRITLVDTAGRVVGDSDFDGPELAALENHATRPEIVEARRTGVGTDERRSASAGDRELYAAVRHPLGAVRASIGTTRLESIVWGAQRDVLAAGALAALGALVLAWIFSRSVSRPVEELRDVARAIAGGDLSRRPSLAAPAEIGDLAAAVHRMSEQLAARLARMEADEALLAAVFESLHEGIAVVDERSRVVRINERGRVLFGVAQATPFAADLLPHDRVVTQALRAAMRGEAVDAGEAAIGGRTLAVVARPLPTGGAVIAAMDLTTRRRLETMRRDFVANVSHELKTPLTVITGNAETLLDPDLPDEQRAQFTRTLHANAERMHRIVEDLLDLSRYESGTWQPALEDVDVAAVVQEVLATAAGEAARKGIALEWDVEREAATVQADPTAVRQILTNLVQNAVRFTAAGSVHVAATRDGDAVIIAVADTGAGIAPQHLSRIFERFYRVDPARSRADGGTGLGLAIVKHLAEAHGGSVRAESTVGRGTTVSVRLPAKS